jgi:hypothetical protein
MEGDNSEKDKQEYLFKEVIQKNYDPEQFQEYLLNAKPGGDDLDNWSMTELATVVTNFQKMCSKEGKEEKKSPEVDKDMEHRKSIIDRYIDDESITKSNYKEQEQFGENSLSESFNQLLHCTAITPSSLLTANNVNVSVFKFDKKEGGIFEQSYVCYYIQTTVINKTVDRRYSDFEWLKATL